jgi:hypothetical protein
MRKSDRSKAKEKVDYHSRFFHLEENEVPMEGNKC